MRHQRQGWRRLVALAVAMLGAMVIAPGLALAGPNSVGATTLDMTDCQAHVVVDWSGQPGRFKSYTVELQSDVDPTVWLLAGEAFTRSGHVDVTVDLTATTEFSNTFRAVTRLFDGKGVEVDSWTSGDRPASCF
jgi:hypothetical protein